MDNFREQTTRQAVLNAAYTLFLKQGYHATSMRQIARQAGLTLGGIYHHFASKEEIFRTVLSEMHPFREIVAAMVEIREETMESFIRRAARIFVEGLRQRSDLLNLMLIEIVEFNGSHVPGLFQDVFPRIMPLFERLVANTPNIRPYPPALILRSFVGLFFSFYISEHLLSNVMQPSMKENDLNRFIEIYLHGILAGK